MNWKSRRATLPTAAMALALVAFPAASQDSGADDAMPGHGHHMQMMQGMGSGHGMMDQSHSRMMHDGMTGMGGDHHRSRMHHGYSRIPMPQGGPIPAARDLTIADVKSYLEQRLMQLGNANLKLGPVQDGEDGRITADIVTKDDSLVQRLSIDPETGRMKQVN